MFSKYNTYDKCSLSTKVFWSMPTYVLSVTCIVRETHSFNYLQSGMPHPGIPVHVWTERGGGVYREGLTGRGSGRRRKYIPFSTHNSRKTCRSEEHYDRHGTCHTTVIQLILCCIKNEFESKECIMIYNISSVKCVIVYNVSRLSFRYPSFCEETMMTSSGVIRS